MKPLYILGITLLFTACAGQQKTTTEKPASAENRTSAATSASSSDESPRELLKESEVKAVISEHIGEVRNCYEGELAKNAELRGDVSIKFFIKHDGTVHTAVVFKSTLRNPTVENCVAQVITTWQFPIPGGMEVMVTYPFAFVPSSDTAATPLDSASPEIASGVLIDPQLKGSLKKSEIRAVINEHVNEVRGCYEKGLATDKNLQGRVEVKFIIQRDGSVQMAVVASSTMGNAMVENCVASVLKTLQFPTPKGGGVVIVTYPFAFSPIEK